KRCGRRWRCPANSNSLGCATKTTYSNNVDPCSCGEAEESGKWKEHVCSKNSRGAHFSGRREEFGVGPAEWFAQARCCGKSKPIFQAQKEVGNTLFASGRVYTQQCWSK